MHNGHSITVDNFLLYPQLFFASSYSQYNSIICTLFLGASTFFPYVQLFCWDMHLWSHYLLYRTCTVSLYIHSSFMFASFTSLFFFYSLNISSEKKSDPVVPLNLYWCHHGLDSNRPTLVILKQYAVFPAKHKDSYIIF